MVHFTCGLVASLFVAVPTRGLHSASSAASSDAISQNPNVDGSFCGFRWHSTRQAQHFLAMGVNMEAHVDHEQQLDPANFCIDDMCVHRGLSQDAAKTEEEGEVRASTPSAAQLSWVPIQYLRARHSGTPPGLHVRMEQSPRSFCEANMPSDERLVVVPHVPAYHGSTALEQVLMSSPHVATLCSAGTWQCEGKWILKHYPKQSILSTYSKYWNLSKRVFLDKRPTDGINLAEDFINPFEKDPLPDAMTAAGINTLRVVYLIMWRPLCLAKLSSHARNDTEFAQHELFLLEHALKSYEYLKVNGHRVLLLNMADVFWDRDYTKQRLQKLMPCLEDVRFDFRPEKGKDVQRCNKWKATGSVQDFASAIDPVESFGYKRKHAHCVQPESDYSIHLQESERNKLEIMTKVLHKLSRD